MGLPFTCNVKAEIVARDDVVEALKEGGCSHAAWSIESGNDYIFDFVYKFENQVINKKNFFAAKTGSDNRMVNISQYVPGNDITAISFIQKKNKKK